MNYIINFKLKVKTCNELQINFKLKVKIIYE